MNKKKGALKDATVIQIQTLSPLHSLQYVNTFPNKAMSEFPHLDPRASICLLLGSVNCL